MAAKTVPDIAKTIRVLGSPETWDQELPDEHSKHFIFFLL